LTRIEWLQLDDTQVGDDGLAYLKDLKQLGWLWAANTRISDAGLVHPRRPE